MVNNKVTAIWNDVCNNGVESKEFLEELEKFHEKIVQRRHIEDDGEQTEETWLKDPPVGPGVEQKNKKEQKSKKTKNWSTRNQYGGEEEQRIEDTEKTSHWEQVITFGMG